MAGLIEIRISYDFDQYPTRDAVASAAVGRPSDFSGTDVRNGWREIGWVTQSEPEAHRIAVTLQAVGFTASIRKESQPAQSGEGK